MKKLLLETLFFSLVMCFTAYADHLTCDPQPASEVTKYRITLNGEILPAGIERVGNDQVRIHYSVDHLDNGEYSATAQAGNEEGEWSGPSNQCNFRRGVSTPQSVGLYPIGEVQIPQRLPQELFGVYHVSSEDLVQQRTAIMAVDGNRETIWHSDWKTTPKIAHPHEIQLSLGKIYQVLGFSYLARQDDSWNGVVKRYEVYVSLDGVTWTEAATGELAKTKNEQLVMFEPRSVKYVSFVFVSEINGNVWASAAEINLLGY